MYIMVFFQISKLLRFQLFSDVTLIISTFYINYNETMAMNTPIIKFILYPTGIAAGRKESATTLPPLTSAK